MSKHVAISPEKAADRLAIRELVEAYALCADFVGQTTVLTLSDNRGTGETYCMPHHLTIKDGKRRLMIAALRYTDRFAKMNAAWLFTERRLYVEWMRSAKPGKLRQALLRAQASERFRHRPMRNTRCAS